MPRSGNAPWRSTFAASGATMSVQICSSVETNPAGSGDMRTSATATEAADDCGYGGNLRVGSTPSSRGVIQSLERGFTPSILLGVGLGLLRRHDRCDETIARDIELIRLSLARARN